jgi:hypothetical protein
MNPLIAETSPLYSQANVVDESFHPENGENYFLSVLVNGDSVSWSVMDRKRNKVIALKNKSFTSEISSPEASFLSALKNDELIGGVNYRSVHVAEVNKFSTLVPAGLFEKGDEEKYLDFNSAAGKNMKMFADRLKGESIVNVFAMDKNIVDSCRQLFPNAVFHHFSTPLIDGILLSSPSSNEKKIHLHIQKTSCEVVVTDGKKLLLYNSYPVTEVNECAYYTMFVMEQLHLNHSETELELLGEITPASELISLLSNYVGKVSLGKRPAMFEYSYGFNEIPGHLYYPLISQHLCAS